MLSQQASLMASNEAFKKQAEGASTAAKKYMEDNELLQEVCPTTHAHTDEMNCNNKTSIVAYSYTINHYNKVLLLN